MPARTITRILARHRVPPLADCDPLTGALIRATRHSTRRYQHPAPGELVHLGVKKLGSIPPTGGWRAMDAVDDHSRYAYAELLPDEKGATCAGVLTRAAAAFAAAGVPTITRVITDNAFAYRHSRAFHAAVADLGARQKFIRPHCPWTNGKIERFNRTLATEWAYQQVYTDNHQRTLAGVLQHPTPPHRLQGPSPNQPPVTNVMARYS